MNIHALTYSITAACLLGTAAAAEQKITGNPAVAGDGVQVGVSKRDGIRIDAGEAYITRNGATEKMVKELALPSGVTVRPDGTMTLPDKTEATLRATQLLTFEGKVENLPVDPAVNPAPVPANPDAAQGSGSAVVTPLGSIGGQAASGSGKTTARDRNNQNGGGSVTQEGGSGGGFPGNSGTNPDEGIFVGADGVPFAGRLNADGSVTTADGRTIPNHGSLRELSFDAAGNPVLGNVQNNGTVTTSDGRTIPFQANRANGQNNAAHRNAANNNRQGSQTPGQPGDNGNNGTPNGNANNGPQGAQKNNVGNSPQTNSPNNTGTTNIGPSGTNGNSNNNAGTVNNPRGNPVTGEPAAGANGGAQGNATAGATTGTSGGRTGGGKTGGATSAGGGHTGAGGGATGAAGGAAK